LPKIAVRGFIHFVGLSPSQCDHVEFYNDSFGHLYLKAAIINRRK